MDSWGLVMKTDRKKRLMKKMEFSLRNGIGWTLMIPWRVLDPLGHLSRGIVCMGFILSLLLGEIIAIPSNIIIGGVGRIIFQRNSRNISLLFLMVRWSDLKITREWSQLINEGITNPCAGVCLCYFKKRIDKIVKYIGTWNSKRNTVSKYKTQQI